MLKDMKMKEEVSENQPQYHSDIEGREISKRNRDAQVTMKVVDPKGKDQIKTLKYEGEMKRL